MPTPLERFNQWYAQLRAWNTAHIDSWAGLTGLGHDGLTHFQNRCRRAVLEVAPTLALQRGGKNTAHLVGTLPGTSTRIVIHPDGGELSDGGYKFICERWDYKTPDDLISDIVSQVKKRVAT